jgi:hypothetical protein
MRVGRRCLDALDQDVRDRGSADFDADSSAQGVPDFRVAPARVFGGELDDELADILSPLRLTPGSLR